MSEPATARPRARTTRIVHPTSRLGSPELLQAGAHSFPRGALPRRASLPMGSRQGSTADAPTNHHPSEQRSHNTIQTQTYLPLRTDKHDKRKDLQNPIAT